MARRSLLGPEERERLFGVPVDRDALVRRYTFDRQDLALIATRRGGTNRLGFAVQLALVRHPGFGLSPTTVVEPLLVAYVADQLGIDPTAFTAYARRAATISDHARILEEALGLRPCARTDLPLMITAAAQAAWSTDKGEPIAAAIMAALREGGIVPPAPDTIERAGLAGRARARKQVAATLLAGLPDALATRLDALLQTDPTLGRPPLSWMKDLPRAPKPGHVRELLRKLAAVRALGLDHQVTGRVHPDRLMLLVREGRITPASILERYYPVAPACHPGRDAARPRAPLGHRPELAHLWLRQIPQAAKPASMLGLLARLEHVHSLGIEPERGRRVDQERLAQIAREATRVTVQHIAGYARQRRHATLVALVLDPEASLTDQAVALFDRMVSALFRSAEGRQARAFQADARAINDKVRLYARVGKAVIAAHTGIRITDLLAEIADWTMFPDCFTHLQTGETAADPARSWPGCWPMA